MYVWSIRYTSEHMYRWDTGLFWNIEIYLFLYIYFEKNVSSLLILLSTCTNFKKVVLCEVNEQEKRKLICSPFIYNAEWFTIIFDEQCIL